MVSRKDANKARLKRHKRVRAKISGTADRPRLCVYRSNAHISAQIIDDVAGVTLVSASTHEKGFEGNCGNKAAAKKVGEIIAERAAAAAYLNSRFAENDAIVPQLLGDENTKPTFHLYLLQIDPEKAGGDIQVLKKKLEAKGVTQIAHFGPLYRFKIVQDMGYDSDEIAKGCPNCEEVFYKRFTHLPLYGLSQEQLTYMADAVLESVKEMQEGK